VASLTPALGTAVNLPFTIAEASRSYSNTSLPNGYSTLNLNLQDNGISVMGAVEVVRIVTGQTTSGSYNFQNVNAPGGSVQVNITANMQNPLLVAISGATATLGQGGTESLTASVSNYTGNIVYVWYVNGVSASTGPTFTFGPTQPLGYYRIDVTASTADGTQAGSATDNTQVIAATPSPSPSPTATPSPTPAPGSTWTSSTLPSISNSAAWVSVAYGNNEFVAVAQSTNIAATSPDGITWTAQTIPLAEWSSVTFGNGIFVAVDYGNNVATSPDGIIWTLRTILPPA
jgi:hypothetical protein